MPKKPYGVTEYVSARLQNQTNSAEGSVLPPRQIGGEFRVPFVTNLRVLKTQQYISDTQFTLSWDNPLEDNLSHYNVYAINAINKNAPPIGPFATKVAPANISIPNQSSGRITFVVQTVLKNGMVSGFEVSPSCTAIAKPRTSSTVSVITTSDATPATISIINIAAGTVVGIESILVAHRIGGLAGSTDDGARYKLSAVYKNISGTATIIGVVTKLADEDQAGWDSNYVLAGSTVQIQVTGAASNDIDWSATIQTYQVN